MSIFTITSAVPANEISSKEIFAVLELFEIVNVAFSGGKYPRTAEPAVLVFNTTVNNILADESPNTPSPWANDSLPGSGTVNVVDPPTKVTVNLLKYVVVTFVTFSTYGLGIGNTILLNGLFSASTKPFNPIPLTSSTFA